MDGYPSEPSSFQSLAHAAATAVKLPVSMATIPPAYKALAARLTHLEHQNKLLRKQLKTEKQRRSNSLDLSPSRSRVGRASGAGGVSRSGRTSLRSSRDLPERRSWPERSDEGWASLIRPPEVAMSADAEVFQKYLEVFQSRARSLLPS